MADKTKAAAGTKIAPRAAGRLLHRNETGEFVAAAKRVKDANTASAEIARGKLKELGILTAAGRLSKNYK